MAESLVVNEIYLSLQGESTWAGLPCVFVRLTGCDLRCSYCDTAYAFAEGKRLSLEAIAGRVDALAQPFAPPSRLARRLPLVEITGGEPLLQAAVLPLMKQLCDASYTVLLETSGAHAISAVDERVHRIVDLKCPSSGESERNHWSNLQHLRPHDEIKFVVGALEDYRWVQGVIEQHQLDRICPLLISWAHPLVPSQQHPSLKPLPANLTPMTRAELADQIVSDALPVRFQVQMHKAIWPPETKGV